MQRRGEGEPACLSRGGHIYKFTIRMRMARGSGRFSVSLPLTSRPEGPISAFLPSLPRCSFFHLVYLVIPYAFQPSDAPSFLLYCQRCYLADDVMTSRPIVVVAAFKYSLIRARWHSNHSSSFDPHFRIGVLVSYGRYHIVLMTTTCVF